MRHPLFRKLVATQEEGNIAILIAGCLLLILILVGTVIDGSGYARAQAQTQELAMQAARVAGNQLDASKLAETGQTSIDAAQAVVAARTYLASSGSRYEVKADGNQVSVIVTGSYAPVFLSILGYRSFETQARSLAVTSTG